MNHFSTARRVFALLLALSGWLTLAPAVEAAGTWTLLIDVTGKFAGTITTPDGKINCGNVCAADYPAGSPIVLTVKEAGGGSAFFGWDNITCNEGRTSLTCTTTMPNAPLTAKATYGWTFATVRVTKQGTGSGTITASPAGINCGQTCSANYNRGTKVVLAVQADAGSAFAGWDSSSSACSNAGASSTCSLTIDGTSLNYEEKPVFNRAAESSATPALSPTPTPSDTASPSPSASPEPSATPTPSPATTPAPRSKVQTAMTSPLVWITGGLVLIAALGLAGWLWRRRSQPAG